MKIPAEKARKVPAEPSIKAPDPKLATASPRALLAEHMRIGKLAGKNWWRDAYVLFRLRESGAYRTLNKPGQPEYPFSTEGFLVFLSDNGSTISLDALNRRLKVFKTYAALDQTLINRVKELGVDKAFRIAPYVNPEQVHQLLDMAKITPYYKLTQGLVAFERTGTSLRTRQPAERSVLKREERAIRAIKLSSTGFLASRLFVPRSQGFLDQEDEARAFDIWRQAMNQRGSNNPDRLFQAVVDFIHDNWLDDLSRRSVEKNARERQAARMARAQKAA